MLAAVVPAQNEAGRIVSVLGHLRAIATDLIITVINGSTDGTLREIESLGWPEVEIIHFSQSLGIDIPRVMGAALARRRGARTTLFVDGDLVGNLHETLYNLQKTIAAGADLALTNCYPFFTPHSPLAHLVLCFRQRLNTLCGLEEALGVSSPSHGPLAVSHRLLGEIPLPSLAIPPLGMVLAHLAGLDIRVAAAIPHFRLGSALKNEQHGNLIAATIIGDCLEAMALYRGEPPSRCYLDWEFRGYDPYRRWDILTQYLAAQK